MPSSQAAPALTLTLPQAIRRAEALSQAGRKDEALGICRRLTELYPDYGEAWHLEGVLLAKDGRHAEALARLDRALALTPDNPWVLNNRSNVLQSLNRPEEALAGYDRSLRLKPDHAEAHNNRGNALKALRRPEEALRSYDQALALKPDYPEALNNRGNTFLELWRPAEALACYDQALALKPDYVEAVSNRGTALRRLNRLGDFADNCRRLLAIAPAYRHAPGDLVDALRQTNCWNNDLPYREAALIRAVRNGENVTLPFPFLAVTDSAADQLQCARLRAARKYPARPALWRGERYGHDRIRLAYLSADFHHHATAYLMAELFERHDRSRFEVHAFSYGPESAGEMRQRLTAAFDRFEDVRGISDAEVARMLREREIDIAIDLKGYTADTRCGILAYRPCPVQVSYLGYPGTLGAAFIDYIVADPVVIPPGAEPFYTEQVVRLPDSYQPNDRTRRIADSTPPRSGHGLPETGFVFCCFNSNYKITPAVFDIWMRLLHRVPGSVLWLLEGNGEAAANLRREAARRGIDPARLVFAPRAGLPDHLARHRHADLFLDTLPVNAHTTASDALWAGLPVLTCLGEAFAARVAGSLLHAAGLPELVTGNLDDYETMAFRLATRPDELAALKQRLAANRLTCPLFDTDRYRRHLEQAFLLMRERAEQGLAPVRLEIDAGAEAPVTAAEAGIAPVANRIPKILHIVWVGDESRRPDNCIRTWIDRNPGWQVRIWGNRELMETPWTNSRHIQAMSKREWNGVADLMRWEILYRHGGFAVDADSVCVRPLPDWLLECEAFACWENELARPGLIAAGYVASVAGNPFLARIIEDIHRQDSVVHDMAWKTVGPQRLTEAYRKYRYSGLTLLPSHFFIPGHFSGVKYTGNGPVFAHQEWASTLRSYDSLHQKTY